jgi:molecular chaperone GrpE (heat shock protein)
VISSQHGELYKAYSPIIMDAILQQVAGWSAAVLTAVGGGALLRRRLSRDRTEITKDRVESEFLVLLLKERDQAFASAREAWRQREEDAQSIARLTSQTAFQQAEIDRLHAEFQRFKRMIARLYPTTRPFLESDFSPPTDFVPS